MLPLNTLDIARERQEGLRREAHAARSKAVDARSQAHRGLRHGIARGLRHVADQLDPASLAEAGERMRLVR